MELMPLAEYGVGIFAVGAFVYCMKMFFSKTDIFVNYVKQRDDQMTKIVTNHMHDAEIVQRQLIVSNEKRILMDDKMIEAINRLVDKLQ